LGRIIPRLPADLAAAVVVIQHIPFAFIPSFAERLNWESALDVKVARDQEHIHAGQVLVAPAEYYCEIAANTNNKSVIKLVTPRPKENFHFPLADRLMASLAPIHRGNAVGVVLTGMGNDGTEGLRAIKKYGGYTIAEDESTSMVFGMPKSAIDAGVVDKVLPLDEIADEIVRVVNG
ncbi:MAG: chemotaxis protein CheB, partial [Candidatus Omnitrophica bacterium]|nr:chemotaxis protein CheB [Candidatus Omnitrophota bacterium]